MHRRRFVAASAVTALTVFAAGFGGDMAAAGKRRNRGGSAFARAKITGSGGRVSASVACGSGRKSTQASGGSGSSDGSDGADDFHGGGHGHGSHGGDGGDASNSGDGAEVTARC